MINDYFNNQMEKRKNEATKKYPNRYATLHTDKQILERLKPHIDKGVIVIKLNNSAGLILDVKSQSFFDNPNDHKKVKSYLRGNAFLSYNGTASRIAVKEPISGEKFNQFKGLEKEIETAKLFKGYIQ